MHTKLTLRLDDRLIERAKEEAAKRGKSVSQMVAEFFDSLGEPARRVSTPYPPITSSLLGVLRDKKVLEGDYKRHLREKYL
ncbi:MAG TPA: antitoxin [Verrucomicrobia bacterium]|nr:MAG: antitoxin [Lentisphaerae bacterium GWF2_57_35]HBA85924.1 antitoxin [Verrucomicrobiota bacterium]